MKLYIKKKGDGMQSLAEVIKDKTRYDMKAYCEINNLSLSSFYKGYISKRAKKVLKSDGIALNRVEHKVAGGSDGKWSWVNKGLRCG